MPRSAESQSSDTSEIGVDCESALPEGVYCVRCGYHLRGTIGDRCPECGYDLAGLRSPESNIPWSNRRQIGRFRAFWATVWAVTVRTRKFCEEHARDVSYHDARLFQWVTILHAFPPLAVGLWAGVFYLRPHVEQQLSVQPGSLGADTRFVYQLILETWPWAVLTVCLIAYLVAATGVPSYFFHPRSSPIRRQNAGLAMSYCTCAPVALTIFPIAIALTMPDRISDASPALMALLLLLWWVNLLRLARGMMPELRIRQAVVALLTPVLWLLLGGLILGVLPVVFFWCCVVVDSLR